MLARYLVVILSLYSGIPDLAAGVLTDLRVTEKHGVYEVTMTMITDAPAEHVHAVLTDYARIYRLNAAITESAVLQSPEAGVVRVKTVMTGCVAFFCRDIARVEDVRELASGDLQAVIVPELSDLRSGAAQWNIQRVGQRTRITYEGCMEPDFFIPPLIGSWFVKHSIRDELKTSFSRIECIAKIQAQREAQREADPDLQMSRLQIASICDGECDSGMTGCKP
ncbi:MAG: hypothetical protein RQ736_13090 [Thiogranum sp.]|nr:hypothetical protein [Thiogranum sp.]